jgi:hypothetical protein
VANGRNLIILKHTAGIVDFKELNHLLDDILIIRKAGPFSETDIKKFILDAVRTDLIVKKAKDLNLERDLFCIGTTNFILRHVIVRAYNNQMIEKQIPEANDDALMKFYQANKDSLFYQLEKSNIYAIIAPDRKTLEDLKSKIDLNIPFEKLTDRILVRAFIRDRDGVVKSYLSKEKPLLGEAALKLKLSEIAGPIEYNEPGKGKQYALIKCIFRQEEKQLQYEEVKDIIKDKFEEYYRNRISEVVDKELKSKYPVVIYKDVLKSKLAASGINYQ